MGKRDFILINKSVKWFIGGGYIVIKISQKYGLWLSKNYLELIKISLIWGFVITCIYDNEYMEYYSSFIDDSFSHHASSVSRFSLK